MPKNHPPIDEVLVGMTNGEYIYTNACHTGGDFTHTSPTKAGFRWERHKAAVFPTAKIGNRYSTPTPFFHAGSATTHPTMDGVLSYQNGRGCAENGLDQNLYLGSGAYDAIEWTWDTPPDRLRHDVEVKALLKLQNQDVNLLQEFATYRQTAGMFVEAAHDIKSIWDFATKNKLPSQWTLGQVARRAAKQSSGKLLAFVYGWRPEAQALYGACKKLQKGNVDYPGFIQEVSASKTGYIYGHGTYPSTNGHAGLTTGYTYKYKGRVKLRYKMNVPLFKSLSEIGISNPAWVIWDKIPWSFVVDWAYPIGNWLQTMTADYGWDFLSGSYSIKETMDINQTGVFENEDWPYFHHGFTFGTRKGSGQKYNRSVYDNTPTPDLRLQNPIKGWHVAEAVALATQQLLKLKFSRDGGISRR